jgi:hypothetical protein
MSKQGIILGVFLGIIAYFVVFIGIIPHWGIFP